MDKDEENKENIPPELSAVIQHEAQHANEARSSKEGGNKDRPPKTALPEVPAHLLFDEDMADAEEGRATPTNLKFRPYVIYTGTYQHNAHTPPPTLQHLLFRRILVTFLKYVIREVIDFGINEYLTALYEQIMQDPEHTRAAQLQEEFYPTSEWIGNPFLFAVERLRLRQAYLFLDDIGRDSAIDVDPLIAIIGEVLDYRVDGPDGAIIVRQRLQGKYGRIGVLPDAPAIDD